MKGYSAKTDLPTIVIDPASELARVLAKADESVVLESNGVRYRVEREPDALFADYDPQKVRAALRLSVGALAGVDVAALKMEIQRDYA